MMSSLFPLSSLRYLPSLSANSIQAKLFLCTCAPLPYPAAAPSTYGVWNSQPLYAVVCLIKNNKTHPKKISIVQTYVNIIDYNPISKKLYKQFLNMNRNLKIKVLQKCIIKHLWIKVLSVLLLKTKCVLVQKSAMRIWMSCFASGVHAAHFYFKWFYAMSFYLLCDICPVICFLQEMQRGWLSNLEEEECGQHSDLFGLST